MRRVLVVGREAEKWKVELTGVAKSMQSDLEFQACMTTSCMFEAIETSSPVLVLLHHNWEGVSVNDLIEQMFISSPNLRVIVYTGQSVKVSELIECVRAGVADYIVKGELQSSALIDKLSTVIRRDSATLKSMRMQEGSVRLLADQASSQSKRFDALRKQNEELARKVRSLEDGESAAFWKPIYGSVKVVIVAVMALVGISAIGRWVGLSGWPLAVAACGYCLMLLFLDGAVKEAILKKGGFTLKGKDRRT